MGEEHPLTLGAVVARAQVVLGGVAVDLIVDEEVDIIVVDLIVVDLIVDEEVDLIVDGAGRAEVLTTVLSLRNHGVSPPKAKKTLRNRGKGPLFCFLNGRVSL